MALQTRAGQAFTVMVNADPRTGGDIKANIGVTAKDTVTGTSYQKTGVADTAWQPQALGNLGILAKGYLNTHNNGLGLAITNLTRAGLVCTATVSALNGRRVVTGQTVTVSGALPVTYNGTFTITKTSATTFTYTVPVSPVSSPATGTILFLPALIQNSYGITGAAKTAVGFGSVSFTDPTASLLYNVQFQGGADDAAAGNATSVVPNPAVGSGLVANTVFYKQVSLVSGAADSAIFQVMIVI